MEAWMRTQIRPLLVMKPIFSVALIARNESKTLPRLISSLSEFQKRGGEIVVLDTGSTDDTASLARSLGCIVHEVGERFVTVLSKEQADAINQKFVCKSDESIVKAGDRIFDYASARNYVASLASHDMVSMPDCDEIYTAFDIDRIEDHIKKGTERFEYNFVFAHDEDGNPLTQFMHSKFYNKKKLSWVGVIHEVLKGEAKTVSLSPDVIKLEHYQNVETNRSGYLVGLAYDIFLDPTNDRNSHYFARELMYKGRYESAISEFKRHIGMNKWATERAQSMIYIGDCLRYLGKEDESFGWYIQAFATEPGRREPLMVLAEYFYKKSCPAQALSFVQAALQIDGINYYSNYQPYYEHVPYEIGYWAAWYLGKKDLSRSFFLQALRYRPHDPKYLHDAQFYFDTNESNPLKETESYAKNT